MEIHGEGKKRAMFERNRSVFCADPLFVEKWISLVSPSSNSGIHCEAKTITCISHGDYV